jgi:transposase
MLVVETIAKIRRAFFQQKKAIKTISRELKVSRKAIRKVIRSEATEFHYERSVQPMPKIGPWRDQLEELLLSNEHKPRRERLTLVRLFEELRGLGYEGGYDAIRRYAKSWAKKRGVVAAEAYIPLSFSAGEAYQFDWSHEIVLIAGVTSTVKVAHFRLCHSRMPFVRAYPRESQEMVFDAHERAFSFFKGACLRGIYDNMKTAVDAVFLGKERQFNRRFLRMCAHYLVEPTACTPAAGWEKGQVENQVGLIRERFFTPRLRVKSYEELNAWLLDKCVAFAKAHKHPELPDKTIWQVFEEERPKLRSLSRRRPPRRGPRLRRPACDPAGRRRHRRTSPALRTRPNHLRPLALCVDPRPQARRAQERRAVQGLGSASSYRAGSPQTARLRRRRPADGGDPIGYPGRRPAGRGGGLRRGAWRGRLLGERDLE